MKLPNETLLRLRRELQDSELATAGAWVQRGIEVYSDTGAWVCVATNAATAALLVTIRNEKYARTVFGSRGAS